jgi:hypothetical protein
MKIHAIAVALALCAVVAFAMPDMNRCGTGDVQS